MTPELAADFRWLLATFQPRDLVELARRLRRDADVTPGFEDGNELERLVKMKWEPSDPRRQAFRRTIRHLVNTPDMEWPEPLRPQ